MENVSDPTYNLPAGYPEALACDTGPTKTNPTQPYTGCNVPIQYYEYHTNPERWSNELRLGSKPGGRLHWLGGLYWEKTRDKNSGSTYYIPGLKYGGEAFQYYAASPFLPPGVWYGGQERSDYLQTTEFANISFDLTDNLSVEAGVVHFHSDFKYYYPYGGFTWDPITPVRSTTFEGSSQKWNSRFGFNYKVADHAMLYGVFSQGFRDGGSNGPLPNDCPGVPPVYVPDTLNNYELGWKTSALNGRFIWNGASYLMEWKDLQTLIYDFSVCPPSPFNANVGDARVYGAESNIDWKLSESWSLQASAAYTDAHLISSKYLAFEGNVGERLPYVPYFNYSANVRYEHALGARLRGYAQFDLAHKGDMWNDLHVEGLNGFPRMLQPAYTIMNLRFGLNPAGDPWLAELYITNLTDKNAIIYTNTGNWDLRQTVSEPRAIGVRLSYRFGKVYTGAQ
jgi:outer membrane receptor protein involved in Fe transport